MAAQLAASALAAKAGSSASKPLLDGEGEEKKMGCWDKFKEWFCANPLGNLPLLGLLAAGVFCIVGYVLGYHIPVAIVGAVALAGGGWQIWALRNLAEEVDKFSKENDRLEKTATRLENEVGFLNTKKEELTVHVDKLEGTVGELKTVSEGLENEVKQFESLKGNLEKFASETGADVKKILGNATKLYDRMQNMAAQNEKALLGKIAQDLEFIDKDVGMAKEEFEAFMERIPEHLQRRFKERNLTFEKVAGADGIIDFMEIEQMIEELMNENKAKLEGVTVQP